MVIGARRSPTMLLSPQQQLQAYVSYDPVSRRAVRFIETTVPTLSSDDEIPADIYYAYYGAGLMPAWISASDIYTPTWDATEKRPYVTLGNNDYVAGTLKQIWPTGVGGDAQSFEPKNGEATYCRIDFRAAFTSSSDYDTGGIGAKNAVAGIGVGRFDTATDHFIQVCRNNTNWELGSCDGSTISQSSAAGGDGNWHDFRVEWSASEIRLYVDDVLKITKTTNLPAQALSFLAYRYDPGTTRVITMMGVKVSWAAA